MRKHSLDGSAESKHDPSFHIMLRNFLEKPALVEGTHLAPV